MILKFWFTKGFRCIHTTTHIHYTGNKQTKKEFKTTICFLQQNINKCFCLEMCFHIGRPIKKLTTECPRSLGPIFILTYHIKWVKTSWTNSILNMWNWRRSLAQNCKVYGILKISENCRATPEFIINYISILSLYL